MGRHKKPKPTARHRRGYEHVLAHYAPSHGAMSRLAAALGTSRAVVHKWKEHGIPRNYEAELIKLTGLRPDQIWG